MENCYWVGMVGEAPTFHPTAATFHEPHKFIGEIRHVLEQYGAAKIVPPHSYVLGSLASAAIKSDNVDVELYKQILRPGGGNEQQNAVRMCSVSEYEFKANNMLLEEFGTLPPSQPDVEIKFWDHMAQIDPPAVVVETSLPVEDSGFGKVDEVGSLTGWNLAELHGHSDSFLRHFDDTTAGLFWGPKVVFRMLYSYNDWKAEGLGSVHYAHAGTGTTWYTVPPSAQRDFEAAKSDMCGPMCPQYLKECGVPIFKLCQYAGEIVVIAPLTYHFTISHGFEIMESASIGLKEWIDKALFGKPQLPIEYAICKEIDFVKQNELDGMSADAVFHAHKRLLTSIQSDLGFLAPHILNVQPPPDILLMMGHFYGFKCTACGRYCHLAIVKPVLKLSCELCTHCASNSHIPSGGYRAIVSRSLGVNICRTNGRVETRFAHCAQNTSSRFHIYGSLPWEGDFGNRGNTPPSREDKRRVRKAIQSLWQSFRDAESCRLPGPIRGGMFGQNLNRAPPGGGDRALGGRTFGVENRGPIAASTIKSDGIKAKVEGFMSSTGYAGHCLSSNLPFARSQISDGMQPCCSDEGGLRPNLELSKPFSTLQGLEAYEAENGMLLPEGPHSSPLENEFWSTLRSQDLALRGFHACEQPEEKNLTAPFPTPFSCGPCNEAHLSPELSQLGNQHTHSQLSRSLGFDDGSLGFQSSEIPQESNAVLTSQRYSRQSCGLIAPEYPKPAPPARTPDMGPTSTPVPSIGHHGLQGMIHDRGSHMTTPEQPGSAVPRFGRYPQMDPTSRLLRQMTDSHQGSTQCNRGGQTQGAQQCATGLVLPTCQASGSDGFSAALNVSGVRLISGKPLQGWGDVGTCAFRVLDATPQDGLRRQVLVPINAMQPKFLLAADVLAALLHEQRHRIPAPVVHSTMQGLFQRASETASSVGMPASGPLQWGLVESELCIILGHDDIRVLYFALDTGNHFRKTLERFVEGVWDGELLDNSILMGTWRQKMSGSSFIRNCKESRLG